MSSGSKKGRDEVVLDLVNSMFLKILVLTRSKDVLKQIEIAIGQLVLNWAHVELHKVRDTEMARWELEHYDYSIVVIDVRSRADLQLVEYLREERCNRHARVILIINDTWDIGDNFTIQHDIDDILFLHPSMPFLILSSLYKSIRVHAYQSNLEKDRAGVEKVLDAMINIMERPVCAAEEFIDSIVKEAGCLNFCAFAATKNGDDFRVISGTGTFDNMRGKSIHELPNAVRSNVFKAKLGKRELFLKREYIGYFTVLQEEYVIYFHNGRDFTVTQKKSIKMVATEVAKTLKYLMQEKGHQEVQEEIIYMLADTIETRSNETGNHVRRMSESASLLAAKAGLPPERVENIRKGAILHDIGKVGISDLILTKPGPLTPKEREIIQTHTTLGGSIMRKRNGKTAPIFAVAAMISEEHHEKWVGGGYPKGIAGEDISMEGRIVALPDVTDALLHKRIYKEAWPASKVKELLLKESGQHFDPKLVLLFLGSWDEFMKINERFPS